MRSGLREWIVVEMVAIEVLEQELAERSRQYRLEFRRNLGLES
jgi:hypothetical protein